MYLLTGIMISFLGIIYPLKADIIVHNDKIKFTGTWDPDKPYGPKAKEFRYFDKNVGGKVNDFARFKERFELKSKVVFKKAETLFITK